MCKLSRYDIGIEVCDDATLIKVSLHILEKITLRKRKKLVEFFDDGDWFRHDGNYILGPSVEGDHNWYLYDFNWEGINGIPALDSYEKEIINDNIIEESHLESPTNSQTPDVDIHKKREKKWNKSEDMVLILTVSEYNGDIPWSEVLTTMKRKIAYFDKNIDDCQKRWGVYDPKISRLLWTNEENAKLMAYVKKYGNNSWAGAAKYIGSKTKTQCIYQYKQIMRKWLTEDGGPNPVGILSPSTATQPAPLSEMGQLQQQKSSYNNKKKQLQLRIQELEQQNAQTAPQNEGTWI